VKYIELVIIKVVLIRLIREKK